MPPGTGGSLGMVTTLVRDPPPAEFKALLERRRQLGQDLFDEVWEGVLHMNPAPHSSHGRVDAELARLWHEPARRARLGHTGPINLGAVDDYRVPDRALLRPGADAVYLPTAAVIVEIVSPDDDTWNKLPFYAERGVDELLIADPQERQVHWLALRPGGEYQPVEHSGPIALGPAELAEQIDWPQ